MASLRLTLLSREPLKRFWAAGPALSTACLQLPVCCPVPLPTCTRTPAADADCTVPVLLATGLAAGLGGFLLLGRGSSEEQVVPARIQDPERLRYLCEGRENLLCAGPADGGSRRRQDWQGQLLQLQKSGKQASGHIRWLAFVQRTLAAHCFDAAFVSVPQVVSLPAPDVRALDAHILTSRPAKQRHHTLNIQESPEHPGQVLGLRLENLFEASGLASMSVQLRPGCGWQELDGLPSRMSMASQLATGRTCGTLDFALELASGDVSRMASVIKAGIDHMESGSGPQVQMFAGQEPLQNKEGGISSALNKVGLPPSLDKLADLVSSVLSTAPASEHQVLQDLRRLQVFALGQNEKLAARLLSELRERAGEAAVEGILAVSQVDAAAIQAGRSRCDLTSGTAHEKAALRLLSKTKWAEYEVQAAQRWLALFLLSRGAIEARLLVSFVRATEGDRSLRYQSHVPLASILPDQSWTTDIWVRVTVVGLQPKPVEEIAQCSTELEDLETKYRADRKSVV